MLTNTDTYCKFCATVNSGEATRCSVCQHMLRAEGQVVQPSTEKKSRMLEFFSRAGARIAAVTFFDLTRN